MDNRKLIDLLKTETGLPSDKAVAEALDQAQPTVSGWVSNKRPMPAEIKFRILDHVNYSPELRKIAACFVDLESHERAMEADRIRFETVKTRLGVNGKQDYGEDTYLAMIDEVIQLNKLDDSKICQILCITESELEKIRGGKLALSTNSKLRLGPLHYWSTRREKLKDVPLPKILEPFKQWFYEFSVKQVNK